MKQRLLNTWKRFTAVGVLPVVSFTTGFALLTFELAAARVLAPTIGSSTYVWTGVIGVIIAALSFGFYVGGRLADGRNKVIDVPALLILASTMATLTLLSYEGILDSIVDSIVDSRLQAVVAAFVLFAPTSFFIGVTSPYLAKLNVHSLKSTGQSIASLDMFNAIGGILGTFITGFFLFGYVGSHQTIGLVALLLLASSWLIAPGRHIGKRLVASGIIILCALTPQAVVQGVTRVDTASAHYDILTGYIDDQAVVGLATGPGGTQSAVYANGLDEPVFWYVREISRLAAERKPSSILILGGGAFTLPQHLSRQLPDSYIDAVEIDPELLTISRKYFGYKDPSNVNEVFIDGRAFVNQSDKQYDMVVVDVYGDTSIPFTFITKEYVEELSSLVAPGGIVAANVIGDTKGKCGEVLYGVDAAYRTKFPYVQYVRDPSRVGDALANNVLLYTKEPNTEAGYVTLEPGSTPIYTDNYAPAERLHYDCQQVVKRKNA